MSRAGRSPAARGDAIRQPGSDHNSSPHHTPLDDGSATARTSDDPPGLSHPLAAAGAASGCASEWDAAADGPIGNRAAPQRRQDGVETATPCPQPGPLPTVVASLFSATVRQRFGRGADQYDSQARLQQATAWRLARLCRQLPLPPGACADLGAGSGLLSRALLQHHSDLRRRPPLQVDLCPDLLARNPLCLPGAQLQPAASLVWDLNTGLPPQLRRAALLASGFALQWLDAPERQLAHWADSLAPGGWLVLVVPTAESFPQWRQAAARAAVTCTALELPAAAALRSAVLSQGLRLLHDQQLRFSRPRQGGLATLRHLRRLGANASRQPPLNPGQLRRLLRHWPEDSPLTWEVLLLVAQRPPQGQAP